MGAQKSTASPTASWKNGSAAHIDIAGIRFEARSADGAARRPAGFCRQPLPRGKGYGDGVTLSRLSDYLYEKRSPRLAMTFLSGGSRIRTGDPMLAKHVLYQLSYTPEEEK